MSKAVITRDRFYEIFDDEHSEWVGDNAIQGLAIIAKYINTSENDIICGADHDILYSVDVDVVIEAGITEEDATALRNLNWHIEDGEYLACFV